MKKKILALCLVVVLVVTAITGATLAYFTDTEQKTNTMVIGNVKINIDEVTYMDEDGDGKPEWDVFEDDEFVLYPVESAQGNAAYNKMVYTANTSPSEDDAYIRNIVLIEKNTQTLNANEGDCCFPGIHYGYYNVAGEVKGSDGKYVHGSKVAEALEETVTINGKEYWVVAFVAADEQAIPYDHALYSLHSVWMDKNVTSEQIAGWGEEGQVDIIVFSQGIQAESLTHAEAMDALGEVTVANVQSWIGADDAVLNDWTTKGN